MDKPSTLAERLAAQRGEVYHSPRRRTISDRLEEIRQTAEAGILVRVPASAPSEKD